MNAKEMFAKLDFKCSTTKTELPTGKLVEHKLMYHKDNEYITFDLLQKCYNITGSMPIYSPLNKAIQKQLEEINE